MDFTQKWVTHKRNAYKQQRESTIHTLKCLSCGAKDIANDFESFRNHIRDDPDAHPDWNTDEAIETAFKAAEAALKEQTETQSPDHSLKRPVDEFTEANLDSSDGQDLVSGGGMTQPNKRRSPPPSDKPQPEAGSVVQQRSRARAVDPINSFEKRTKNPSGRQLWTEDSGLGSKGRPAPVASPSSASRPTTNNSKAAPRQSQPASQPQRPQHNDVDQTTQMMLQPETRPISQDQLVAEVKGIYAGLVMVETKCIEVDNAQSSNTDASKLNNEQWQALIALHRTLLHEHHDFFLASQHPSASAPLRRLASKYAMPARMWRHGIHSFLELLRHRLPASLEHMLTFLYLAYSMMALLYETVPAFEDTWIECLGDLGRYRMAIEDDDIRDREVWTGVSRHWYSKASDKSPTTGRLYHHLAILARPNALQQHFFYAKSLCVPIPFLSARESVMTLYDPVLGPGPSRLTPIDTAFVRVHGILFSGKSKERLEESMDEFLGLLDTHISRTTKRWLEAGYFIGISLACSLLGYGDESSILMKAIARKSDDTDVVMEGSNIAEAPPSEVFTQALSFAVRTYGIVIRRWGDTNILPFVHTTLVFMNYMTRYPTAMACLEKQYPWKLTALLLNYLLASFDKEPRMDGDFPGPEKEELPRPLPEDYALRGLIYAEDYHPQNWFTNEKIDEDEKFFELASMVDERKERILYLGYQIASQNKWLNFDHENRIFSVTSKYDVEVEVAPQPSTDTSEREANPSP